MLEMRLRSIELARRFSKFYPDHVTIATRFEQQVIRTNRRAQPRGV